MYQKSAESKAYVDAWLFMSLHFICALRITDLKQFPHPHLPCPPEDVLQKVKEGTFTDEEAKKTQASICYILDATMPVPNKTKAYSGVPSIHFHIPSSLEVHFGKMCIRDRLCCFDKVFIWFCFCGFLIRLFPNIKQSFTTFLNVIFLNIYAIGTT